MKTYCTISINSKFQMGLGCDLSVTVWSSSWGNPPVKKGNLHPEVKLIGNGPNLLLIVKGPYQGGVSLAKKDCRFGFLGFGSEAQTN